MDFCPDLTCSGCVAVNNIVAALAWDAVELVCFGIWPVVPGTHSSFDSMKKFLGSCVPPKVIQQPQGCPKCWEKAVSSYFNPALAGMGKSTPNISSCFHFNDSLVTHVVV